MGEADYPEAANQKQACTCTPARTDVAPFDARAQPLALSPHLLLTQGFITHTVSFSNLSEATLHTPTTNKVAVSLHSVLPNTVLE